jgi:putative methionine-R-sulfoxide reductase with GAF domain
MQWSVLAPAPAERENSMSTNGNAESNPLRMPRRSWGNWILLAGSYVITTSGLALAVALLLPDRLSSPWPWVRTDYALITACVFLVVTLVIHLSLEQRHMDKMNAEFQRVQHDVHATSRKRLYALLSVSRIMGLQSDLQNVFQSITAACLETFPCDQASLMLFDPQRKRLVVRAAHGHEDVSKVLGSEKEIGEGIAGWVAKHKTPLILGRPGERNLPPELQLLSRSISAAIVVPIILREELVGVINISSRSPETVYEIDDMHALSVFAENAGACIRHAEQAEWMRKTIAGLREHSASTVGAGLKARIAPD